MNATISNDPIIESVTEIEHYWVPMADGVGLSARLWLPQNLPAPTILEYIPYRKRDMVRARDERNHPWFAARGYACVRVDMRGSGDSEGQFTDMYSDAELADAHQVIDWIAAQSWCDGAIGMMGTSWGGTSALQAAAASDTLKAVIAVCATDNRYEDDIHHMGGCLLTDSIEWGASLPAIIAMPPAAETAPDNWREAWLERLENLSFPLQNWIEHESKDDYWRHGSVSEQPGAIRCPVLAIGGWSDRYSNTIMNLIGRNPDTCWGIIGPWGHHYPDLGCPGPAMNFQQEALRWWDRWLKNDANGVGSEPRLRAWCGEFQVAEDWLAQRHGRWICEPTWPSDKVARYNATLSQLTNVDNGTASADGFVEIPSHLSVGQQAGDTGYFGRPGGLPLDQAKDDANSLVLETEPLDAALEILGKVALNLDIRTNRHKSAIVIRLSDIAPDGAVSRVVFAVKNLALDQNFNPRHESIVGRILRETIDFPNIAHRFNANHKIRIAISTSYWPIIWTSPKTVDMAINIGSLTLSLPQRRQIPTNNSNFSIIELPSEESNTTIVSNAGIKRQQIENRQKNSICHRWFNPFVETEHNALAQKFGVQTCAEHYLSFLDPTSAHSSFEHTLQLQSDELTIRVTGRARLDATENHFLPQVSIRVIENDREIFSKNWSRRIERKYS